MKKVSRAKRIPVNGVVRILEMALNSMKNSDKMIRHIRVMSKILILFFCLGLTLTILY